MLMHKKITSLDIWNRIVCPICCNNSFVSMHNSGVYCETCNSSFTVNHCFENNSYCVSCQRATVYEKKYSDIAERIMPDGHAYLVDRDGEHYSGWIAPRVSFKSCNSSLQRVYRTVLTSKGAFNIQLIKEGDLVLAENFEGKKMIINGLFTVKSVSGDTIHISNSNISSSEFYINNKLCLDGTWKIRLIRYIAFGEHNDYSCRCLNNELSYETNNIKNSKDDIIQRLQAAIQRSKKEIIKGMVYNANIILDEASRDVAYGEYTGPRAEHVYTAVYHNSWPDPIALFLYKTDADTFKNNQYPFIEEKEIDAVTVQYTQKHKSLLKNLK